MIQLPDGSYVNPAFIEVLTTISKQGNKYLFFIQTVGRNERRVFCDTEEDCQQVILKLLAKI